MDVPSISVIVRQAISMQSLFQNVCRCEKWRKDLFFCRRNAIHILFPCLFPKTRRLRPAKVCEVPGAGTGPSLRQAGPPGPSREGSAPTHIPRRRGPGLSPRRGSSSSPRRAPQVRAQEPSGGDGSANYRASPAPAQPVSAEGGRYGSRSAPFCSSSSLLPAAHTTPTSGRPSQLSSPPCLRSAAGDALTQPLQVGLQSSSLACSRRRRCSHRAGARAGVGDWRAPLTARAPLPGAALLPARAAGPTGAGHARPSPVKKPRARAQIPGRAPAWWRAKSLSWLRRAGGALQMGVCVAAARRADDWE